MSTIVKGLRFYPHNFINAAEDMTPQSETEDFIYHSTGSNSKSTYLHYFPLSPSSIEMTEQSCVQIDVVNYRIDEPWVGEPNVLSRIVRMSLLQREIPAYVPTG